MEYLKTIWLFGAFATAFLYGRYLWDELRYESDTASIVTAFIYCLIWPVFWVVFFLLTRKS